MDGTWTFLNLPCLKYLTWVPQLNDQIIYKESFLFIKLLQLINKEEIIEVEYYHLQIPQINGSLIIINGC